MHDDDKIGGLLDAMRIHYKDAYESTEYDYDYNSNVKYGKLMKQVNDPLAPKYRPSDVNKMLTEVMDHLSETGDATLLVLKFPQLGEWYADVLEKRRVERVRRDTIEKYENTFSKEEKVLLEEILRGFH